MQPEAIEHTADRPSWACRTCGDQWPCGPAREALTDEMSSVPRRIFAWAMLEEAAMDLPPGEPLFERFVSWA